MYCPKCGRQVNNNANFCGGCGLAKKEIDEQLSKTNTYSYTEPVFEKAPKQTGEVENFVEQPFPTDVEFKDVSGEENGEDPEMAADSQNTEVQQPSYAQYSPSQEQYQRSQEQHSSYQESVVSKNKKDGSISTVDFVWMIILSLIPGINLIYLFYLAFIQNNNINKRSYARAVFIVVLFLMLIVAMFGFGFFMANLIY